MRRATLLTAAVLALTAVADSHAASSVKTFEQASTKASVACTAGLRSVVVNGADSRICVTGRCRSIAVNGADVRVVADVVDRITVNASQSRVSYKRSRSGGRAKVSTTAVGAKVTRR